MMNEASDDLVKDIIRRHIVLPKMESKDPKSKVTLAAAITAKNTINSCE